MISAELQANTSRPIDPAQLARAQNWINQPYKNLERQTSIHRATWSRWFNGRVVPNVSTLGRLAKCADVDFWAMVEAFHQRRSHTVDSAANRAKAKAGARGVS